MNRVTASERVRKELGALLTGKETSGDVRQFASEFVRLAVRRLIQEFLEAERTDFLGREAWERKPDSRGHRNGYEPARLKTGEGEIPIELPQYGTARSPFTPGCEANWVTGPKRSCSWCWKAMSAVYRPVMWRRHWLLPPVVRC